MSIDTSVKRTDRRKMKYGDINPIIASPTIPFEYVLETVYPPGIAGVIKMRKVGIEIPETTLFNMPDMITIRMIKPCSVIQ